MAGSTRSTRSSLPAFSGGSSEPAARFPASVGRLHSLSPLAVLGRGYAVCWDGARARIIRRAADVAAGDAVRVTLGEGEIACEVTRVEPDTAIMTIKDSAPIETIKDFEAALSELESIVKRLEDGDLTLESSLALYERGVELSRFCHSRLEQAERRIEILNERGDFKPAPPGLGEK